MATASTKLPFEQCDGIARTTRRIAQVLRSNKNVAVLLIWLSGIERICASAGHLVAENLIDNFHEKLAANCRHDDLIERISDRKFAVVLSGPKNRGHVTLAARKIERIIRDNDPNTGSGLQVNTITGVALGPEQADEPHDLLRMAEVAQLEARSKNDSLCFFEQETATQLLNEWELERKLKDALEAGDLQLHLQPKTDIRSGEIVAAEALSRWTDPDIGTISPELFVSVAESTNQIVELTQFTIQSACRLLSEWREALPEIQLAINISPRLISNPDIVEILRSATSIWGVPPERLTLEITETALMDNRDVSFRVLTAIREFGCGVSIDDFGTGYSSLAYLKDIPADELKIDRTFVMGMLEDRDDYKIVEHTINIAKSFDLTVVAEGIESEDALSELKRMGCDYAQGYYISKPLPANEFLRFCREHTA